MHLRPFSWNMYRKWQIPTDTLPLQSTKIRSLLQLHGKFEISLTALSYIPYTIFRSNFHSCFLYLAEKHRAAENELFWTKAIFIYPQSGVCTANLKFGGSIGPFWLHGDWRLRTRLKISGANFLRGKKKKSFFLSKNWHFQENNERSIFHLVIHQSSQSWQHCAECSS